MLAVYNESHGNKVMVPRRLTASLRSFTAFRLMHLPHHVQPMTATSAIATPAAVPPAIAVTGIADATGFEAAPIVGKLPEPAEVTVVVTNEGKAGTLIVVKTGVCVGPMLKEREKLVVASVEVGGMRMDRWGRNEEPGKKRWAKTSWLPA